MSELVFSRIVFDVGKGEVASSEEVAVTEELFLEIRDRVLSIMKADAGATGIGARLRD